MCDEVEKLKFECEHHTEVNRILANHNADLFNKIRNLEAANQILCDSLNEAGEIQLKAMAQVNEVLK